MTDKEFDEYIRSSDAVFHYTSRSAALENILYDGKFRLSQLINTNDPAEYKFKLYGMIGWGLDSEEEKLHGEAHPVLDRILRKETRIMSLCSNEKPEIIVNSSEPRTDDTVVSYGWGKSRMWSQYGESHAGICLVFSRKALESKFKDAGGDVISANVKYNTTPDGSAFILNGNHLAGNGVEYACISHIKRYADTLLFTKNIDYRDEAEYRIVVFDAGGQHEYVDINNSIRGIISGDRMPKVYLPIMKDFAVRYNVVCRRLYWANSGFVLLYCTKNNS